jgi:hypothetical protein
VIPRSTVESNSRCSIRWRVAQLPNGTIRRKVPSAYWAIPILVMELIGYAVDAELVLAFQNETRSAFDSFFFYRSFGRGLEGLRLSSRVEVGPGRQIRKEYPNKKPRIAVQRPGGQ